MAADDVVGIDLELRLGVELGGRRQQQTMARLLAVRLLGAALDDDLALEDAPRLLVDDAFEDLAACAARERDGRSPGAYRSAAGSSGGRRRGCAHRRPSPSKVVNPCWRVTRPPAVSVKSRRMASSANAASKLDRWIASSLSSWSLMRSSRAPLPIRAFDDGAGEIGAAFAEMGLDERRRGAVADLERDRARRSCACRPRSSARRSRPAASMLRPGRTRIAMPPARKAVFIVRMGSWSVPAAGDCTS